MEKMGTKLKELVKLKKLNAEKLAKMIGVAKPTVYSMYKRPRLTPKRIEQICEAVGVDTEYFNINPEPQVQPANQNITPPDIVLGGNSSTVLVDNNYVQNDAINEDIETLKKIIESKDFVIAQMNTLVEQLKNLLDENYE